ncbi:MAG TPA: hypothetical protein VMT28_12665 [Terriglobales bacterium]|nr:hypothetical protein [Terriglobales bacterium]
MSTSPAAIPNQQPASPNSTSHSSFSAFATRFVDWWWVDVPCKLRQWSTLLWAAWSDGIYLTAWPRVATVLVFAVFLFGFVEGNTHWSYRTIVGSNGFAGNVLAPSATANNWGGPTRLVFAENLVLLLVAVGVGSLSANLGLTLVLGYALGDIFFLGARPSNFRYDDVIAIWIVAFDQKTYHGETGWGAAGLKKGSRITILYNPENPARSHPLHGFLFYSFR